MSQHFECKGGDDAAAYVLGALDDIELTGFRRHLDTCSVCQAEVQSLKQLTDVLPMTAPHSPVPKALRRRVMADVRADARRHQAARDASSSRQLGGLRIGGRRLGAGYGLARPRLAGLMAGATVLALIVVLITVAAPRKATHEYHASIGSAQVVVSNGRAELIVHKLGQLSVAQTYEVWEKSASGTQPTNALFNTSSDGSSAVNVPGSLRGVHEILVTAEPAGGRAVPTGKIVVATTI